MKPSHIALSTLLAASMTLTGCIDQTKDAPNQIYIYVGDDNTTDPGTPGESPYPDLPKETLAGDIAIDTTLTADKAWVIDGLVVVRSGVTLTIEEGTIIIGKDGTGTNTSYMIVDKGAQIIADGTETNPIIFTSELEYDGTPAAVGQWGGLTIIGNAADPTQLAAYEVNSAFTPGTGVPTDDSGILRHVKILNSGITMEQDKEINGLSLVGVGSGTTIEDITVVKSDDDCIEAWGGTVNMTNITLRECTDDQFDIDDGYSGTVTNLNIHQTATNAGNAGIEMSGITAATFDGFTIVQDASAKEGGIFFKNAGIGGHFLNGTVTDNINNGAGAIHTSLDGDTDIANTSFNNVTLTGTSTDPRFTGDDAANVEAEFDAGTGNSK